MYNIIQLNDKNLSELQTIAQELGIKKTDSLKKEELVYKILDEQAIAGATKKVAADKLKEERKGEKQKRSRVTVKTVKKEGADKVFSANKNGDLTKAKTEEAPAAKEQPKTVEAPQEPTIEAATPAPAKEAAVPKRKPGRPRKVKEETAAPQATETPKVAEPELNFEAKAPKTEPQAEAKAEKNIVPDESPILAEAADDFIPIEDLPTEKIELPSELIGKFEATKAELPPLPLLPLPQPNRNSHNARASAPATTTTHTITTTITTATVAITNSAPCSSALHNRITTERTIPPLRNANP